MLLLKINKVELTDTLPFRGGKKFVYILYILYITIGNISNGLIIPLLIGVRPQHHLLNEARVTVRVQIYFKRTPYYTFPSHNISLTRPGRTASKAEYLKYL